MSYKFTDVDERPQADIPAEAVYINGKLIEDEIDGYRTLYVKGREALSPEIDSADNITRTGSTIKSRRYPARTITVGYQIISHTPEEFRAKFNTLARLLDVEEGQFVFADEPDKYFVGTISDIDEVEPGTNSITGEYTIFCADPLKYSIDEYTVDADENGLITVNYDGIMPSYPVFDVANTGDADWNSMSLVKSGSIISFGPPNTFVTPDVALTYNFTEEGIAGWESAIALMPQALEYYDDYGEFPDGGVPETFTPASFIMQYGELSMNSDGLYLSSAGQIVEGDQSSRLSFGTYTMVLQGNYSTVNFEMSWSGTYSKDASLKGGMIAGMAAQTTDGSVVHFASMRIVGGDGSRTIELYLLGEKVGSFAANGTDFSGDIIKDGTVVYFIYAGKEYPFEADHIGSYEIMQLSLGIEGYDDATLAGAYFRTVVVNVHKVPYAARRHIMVNGDEAQVLPGEADITRNGVHVRETCSIDNAWDDFKLEPGNNEIRIVPSAIGTDEVGLSATMKYRKAYL